MKTHGQIKKDVKKYVLSAFLNGGLSPTKAIKESVIATELIMEIIKPYLKKKENNGNELKFLYDWYIELYKSKFGEKAIWGISWVNVAKGLLKAKPEEMNMESWMDCLFSCFYVYFYKLNSSYVDNAGYPFGLIGQNLTQCKLIVKENFKHYNLNEDKYYQKYVEDILKKLNLKITKYGGSESKD